MVWVTMVRFQIFYLLKPTSLSISECAFEDYSENDRKIYLDPAFSWHMPEPDLTLVANGLRIRARIRLKEMLVEFSYMS